MALTSEGHCGAIRLVALSALSRQVVDLLLTAFSQNLLAASCLAPPDR